MCLEIKRSETKAVKGARSKTEPITLYKVVKVAHELDGGPFLYSLCAGTKFEWKPGWNIAKGNWFQKILERWFSSNINIGIHVGTMEHDTIQAFQGRSDYVTIAVQCYVKDLVGVNVKDHHEVYNKVFLTQEEYDRVMDKIKGKKEKKKTSDLAVEAQALIRRRKLEILAGKHEEEMKSKIEFDKMLEKCQDMTLSRSN